MFNFQRSFFLKIKPEFCEAAVA